MEVYMNILTLDEVAGLLKINRATVKRYLKKGRLKGFRLGDKLLRVKEEEVENFIKGKDDNNE